MLTRWSDWNRPMRPRRAYGDYGRMIDELRNRMMRLFEEMEPMMGGAATAESMESRYDMPQWTMFDAGDKLMIMVDVPGMTDKDIDLTVNEQILTLKAHRRTEVPEGYTVHRRERGGEMNFTRSVTLPIPIDASKASAHLENGVLTIALPKSKESRPRQISVKSR